MINKIHNESCLDTLSKMPDNFIDCVITSPPYWQLRDYGYPEQWGLESTYSEYLDHLWSMMDEVYRVLKPEGTAWINLGDTYGTQSGGLRGKNTFDPMNKNATQSVIEQPKTIHKCLLMIPHRFVIGCIDRGWIVRNDIVWAKRNGMPESVTDRFSKKHEYFFFMVKSTKYHFDLDAIRCNHIQQESSKSLNKKAVATNAVSFNPLGKNPGSVSDFWDIPTKPSSNEHYAAYNDELIKKPILAGCPENGIIYDPFMGTGSTAEAALRANRQYIGSEMSTKYCEIANNRLTGHKLQQKMF